MEPATRSRRGARRATAWAWLVAASVGASAAAAWLGFPALERRQALRTGAEALARLERCLFGPGAEPSRHGRLRERAVAASLSGAPWPARCEAHASLLASALARLGRHAPPCAAGEPCPEIHEGRRVAELGARVGRLRATLARGEIDDEAMKGVAAAARALGIEPDLDAGGAVPPPPEPLETVRAAGLVPLSVGTHREILTDPPAGSGIELLLYAPPGRYRACALEDLAAASARCRDLHPALPVAAPGALFAGERGAPRLLFAVGPASRGVFEPDTGRLALALALEAPWLGGWVAGADRFALLDGAGRHAAVVARSGERSERLALGLALEPSWGPALVYEHVLWTEPVPGAHLLRARRLVLPAGGPATLEAPASLGRLALAPPISAHPCRAEGGVTALLLTSEREEAGALVLLTAQGWLAAEGLEASPDAAGLTCDRAGASVSSVEAAEEDSLGEGTAAVRGRYLVRRIRCEPGAACRTASAVVTLRRHHRSSRYVVGDLGAAMFLLYRGPLGDVRARVAPLEELDRAADRALFDDEEHGGFAWEAARGGVFVRDGVALVLVHGAASESAPAPLYGLVLSPSGAARPVSVLD